MKWSALEADPETGPKPTPKHEWGDCAPLDCPGDWARLEQP